MPYLGLLLDLVAICLFCSNVLPNGFFLNGIIQKGKKKVNYYPFDFYLFLSLFLAAFLSCLCFFAGFFLSRHDIYLIFYVHTIINDLLIFYKFIFGRRVDTELIAKSFFLLTINCRYHIFLS